MSSQYQQLVEWYSSCTLTKEEDKFVAFSGIAKCFQSALGSEYLAGLWKDNLPIELLWRVSRAESDTVRRPYKHCASSWSWASVNTQIINKFVVCKHLFIIAVVDRHVEHLASDLFSQVTGGWIRMRGALYQALLYASENVT